MKNIKNWRGVGSELQVLENSVERKLSRTEKSVDSGVKTVKN